MSTHAWDSDDTGAPPSRPRRARLLPQRSELPLLVKRPRAIAIRYRWPLLVLLCGAVLDGITTFNNLRAYGAGVEVHPAHRIVYELLPPAIGAPVGKLLQLAFVLFVAAWWRPWFASSPSFDSALWTAAVRAHDVCESRIHELSPANVLGSRPVDFGNERYNEGFVWYC